MNISKALTTRLLSLVLVVGVITLTGPLKAGATSSTQGVPDQASCDSSGSFPYAWTTMGIARPQIASMSVDGEAIADPTNPTIGSLGATICANTALGNRTGLMIYQKVDSMTSDFDLTGATTPLSHTALTPTSKITITMTNMGDLAPYFSFALVHGLVSQWTTANLGTHSASLTVVLTPTRTPFGSGTDFGGCTATPPWCNALKSDVDALSASLDFTLNQDAQSSAEFAGAYFALTGAMGGFVKADHSDDGTPFLSATLGAPHYLADGVTANVGSMQAFLPTNVLEHQLNITSGTLSASDLVLTRTESGATGDAPCTVTPVTGGAIISVSSITFSNPTYAIKKFAAVATSTPKAPGLPNTGEAPLKQDGSALPLAVAGIISLVAAVYLGTKRGSNNR